MCALANVSLGTRECKHVIGPLSDCDWLRDKFGSRGICVFSVLSTYIPIKCVVYCQCYCNDRRERDAGGLGRISLYSWRRDQATISVIPSHPLSWFKRRTRSVSCNCFAHVKSCLDPDVVLRRDSVHDGWGVAHEQGLKGNAIEAGTTTNMDTIAKEHAYRTLAAHGLAVGLSDGLMGNSEVGFVSPLSIPRFLSEGSIC